MQFLGMMASKQQLEQSFGDFNQRKHSQRERQERESDHYDQAEKISFVMGRRRIARTTAYEFATSAKDWKT